MALSNEDWNRFDRMRAEDKDHLKDITERFTEDSRRQWQEMQRINSKVDAHVSKSDTVHAQPCPTALALYEKHIDDSAAHNPKKTLPILAALFTIAGVVGGWIFKLFHTKAATPVLLVSVLALVGGGCNPASTVFEEDRVLLDLTKQIIERQAVEIQKLDVELGADALVLSKLLPIAGNLKKLNDEAGANLGVFVSNWGAPGVAQMYSDEVNGKAREAAKAAHHDAGFWGKIGLSVLTGAATVIAILRTPAAKLIPFVGQIVAACDPLLAGVEKFMATMKATGNVEAADELASHLISEQQLAKVDRFVTKRLDKVKRKIAPALDAIAELTPNPDSDTKILKPDDISPT